MSGAEKLTNRIISDAEAKAQGLVAEAEAKAAALIEQAAKEAEALIANAAAQAEAAAREEARHRRADLVLEQRKGLLATKQALIDQAFEQALTHLAELPKEQYQALMQELLLKSVSSGDEEIIIAPHDEERFDVAFLAQVNQKLVAAGKAGHLRLAAERRPIRAGFILKSPGLQVNNSLENMLQQERYGLETEVANLLFGSGGEHHATT